MIAYYFLAGLMVVSGILIIIRACWRRKRKERVFRLLQAYRGEASASDLYNLCNIHFSDIQTALGELLVEGRIVRCERYGNYFLPAGQSAKPESAGLPGSPAASSSDADEQSSDITAAVAVMGLAWMASDDVPSTSCSGDDIGDWRGCDDCTR